MQYDWFNISKEQRNDWEALCPLNEFRVVSPDSLPGPLPSGLTRKYDSVLVAASGTTGGTAYFMVNGNRVEEKRGEVDQMPCRLQQAFQRSEGDLYLPVMAVETPFDMLNRFPDFGVICHEVPDSHECPHDLHIDHYCTIRIEHA